MAKKIFVIIAKIILYLVIIGLIVTIAYLFIKEYKESNEEINPIDLMAETTPEDNEQQKVVDNSELKVQELEIDGTIYEVVAVLEIPRLEIEYPVFSSTSKELLKVSLNKYWGPNPNRPGNFCILGHNYNDEKFFGKLNQIQIGDIVKLTDMYGITLYYKVYDTFVVDPDNTDCTSQLTDGETEITLITCTKDFKNRFVVKARV